MTRPITNSDHIKIVQSQSRTIAKSAYYIYIYFLLNKMHKFNYKIRSDKILLVQIKGPPKRHIKHTIIKHKMIA